VSTSSEFSADRAHREYFGQENTGILQNLKRVWDPSRVFNHPHSFWDYHILVTLGINNSTTERDGFFLIHTQRMILAAAIWLTVNFNWTPYHPNGLCGSIFIIDTCYQFLLQVLKNTQPYKDEKLAILSWPHSLNLSVPLYSENQRNHSNHWNLIKPIWWMARAVKTSFREPKSDGKMLGRVDQIKRLMAVKDELSRMVRSGMSYGEYIVASCTSLWTQE
jgi:hypothetical protein